MKKVITKLLFLFFKYYDKGSTKDIAYESSILAFIGLTILNLAALFNFFDVDLFFLVNSNYPRFVKYLLCFVIYLLPAFLLIRKYFPKIVVAQIYMNKSTLRKGYFLVILYVILSISMLILSVEYL